MFLQLSILEVKEEVVGEFQSSWTSCRNSDTDTHSGILLCEHTGLVGLVVLVVVVGGNTD